MDSFHDLEKSNKFEDRVIYDYLIKLLDALFSKHSEIMIDLDVESEKNQELIRDQAKFIGVYFEVPKRVFSTQKCVRQTLKHIVDYLNNKYQFKRQIQFQPIRKTVRAGEKTFAASYSVFSLI